MNTILVIKIVIQVTLLGVIFGIFGLDIDDHPKQKRYDKTMMGIAYMVTALLSIWVAGYLGKSIYFYTICGFMFSVGSFLPAINTNLREIYLTIIGCIFWSFIAYGFLYANHRTIWIIFTVIMILGIPMAIKEGIDNMRAGIDPDVVAEEKERARKSKLIFNLVKIAIKGWWL